MDRRRRAPFIPLVEVLFPQSIMPELAKYCKGIVKNRVSAQANRVNKEIAKKEGACPLPHPAFGHLLPA
jgi:hypothetical protein